MKDFSKRIINLEITINEFDDRMSLASAFENAVLQMLCYRSRGSGNWLMDLDIPVHWMEEHLKQGMRHQQKWLLMPMLSVNIKCETRVPEVYE